MLLNQDIKNLVQGVSQQPPILRRPEQLDEQLNGFSTEADGLQKRPPTVFIHKLHQKTQYKPLIHFVDRDSSEQYVMIFDGSSVYVYDLQGNSYTVSFEGNARNYIQNINPRSTLRCLTIADYTFVTNLTKKVAMTNDTTGNAWDTQGLLINVKSGQYGRTYSVTINGTQVASYQTPDGSASSHVHNIQTDYIVERLANQITGDEPVGGGDTVPVDYEPEATGWSVTKGTSWLYVYGQTAITSFEIKDNFNNQAAFGFHKTTQKFSNLPVSAPNGFTVQVKGEEGSEADDYYVKYSTADQVWKECARPGIPSTFDKSTMPHVLIRQFDNNNNPVFVFKEATWDIRETGDEDSNPIPSFVGHAINNLTYFRNRLGFLSDENIILTRTGDFFNFWMQSAVSVQDTDPIDLAVSDNKIATLYYAVPFDTELILFSKDAQFSLMSTNVLSPKDAYIPPAVTHFGASLKAAPVNAGRNIYFPAERNQYTTMREFFTAMDNTESKDVQDITAHVPNYIPNGVYKLIPSTIENILLSLTEGEEDAIYVYKYLFIDGQRQQASWSKWDMGDDIVGGDFVNSYFYIVIERNGWFCLERMSFAFNTKDNSYEPYRILLDSKQVYTVSSGAYDAINDETTLDVGTLVGDTYESDKQYSIVTNDMVYQTSTPGESNGSQEFILNGDYRNKKVTIGINYMFRIALSPLYVKQEGSTGYQAMVDGRLQLRQAWFNYSRSGGFDINVSIPDKRANFTYKFTSRELGTDTNVLGSMPFNTGKFKFPIQSQNTDCQISLSSDTPLPVNIVGAGWVGNYVRRTRLY